VGDVDLYDRAPAGRWVPLRLRADGSRDLPGTLLTESGLEASFDDGATWKRVTALWLRLSSQGLAHERQPAREGLISPACLGGGR
jgi:hypothetical protein